jgi:hypothetical protein
LGIQAFTVTLDGVPAAGIGFSVDTDRRELSRRLAIEAGDAYGAPTHRVVVGTAVTAELQPFAEILGSARRMCAKCP